MRNIPTITIQPKKHTKHIDINVPNIGGGSGNQFTNWVSTSQIISDHHKTGIPHS